MQNINVHFIIQCTHAALFVISYCYGLVLDVIYEYTVRSTVYWVALSIGLTLPLWIIHYVPKFPSKFQIISSHSTGLFLYEATNTTGYQVLLFSPEPERNSRLSRYSAILKSITFTIKAWHSVTITLCTLYDITPPDVYKIIHYTT